MGLWRGFRGMVRDSICLSLCNTVRGPTAQAGYRLRLQIEINTTERVTSAAGFEAGEFYITKPGPPGDNCLTPGGEYGEH